MRYDYIIIDVLNVAHRYFNHAKESPSFVSKKQVFKKSVCNFITKVEQLEKDFLHSTGEVYLLIDNPTSRIDLQSSFYFADRKEAYNKYKKDRAKQPKEFYNSINLLKYYYLVSDSHYHTIQIPKLEADDLVEPILRLKCNKGRSLLMTNDLDWVRYLGDAVDWIPDGNTPENVFQLSERLGFPVNTKNVVAYKALLGDAADHIPRILTDKHKQEVINLLEDLDTADDLLFIINKEEMLKKHPILETVSKDYNQLRINLQLVEAIPVSDRHIESIVTTGRDSLVCRSAVRRAIELDKEKPNTFVFGGIKRPRIC